MIPAIVAFVYLAVVLYVGTFASRKSTGCKEVFLSGRRPPAPRGPVPTQL